MFTRRGEGQAVVPSGSDLRYGLVSNSRLIRARSEQAFSTPRA
jgi:hypothetical protein